MADRLQLLIVDDDVNFRTTLAKILDRKRCDTTVAESGFAAIELVREKPFDAVLMDFKMPAMNGVEAYKRLKENRPDTVVTLMTAFSFDDRIREALHDQELRGAAQ